MKSHFMVHTNGQDECITVGKRTYDKAIDMFCAAHEAELKAKDERIAELEAMIEKMKCCENCSFYPPQKCRFDTQYGCLDGLIPTNWKIKGTNNE